MNASIEYKLTLTKSSATNPIFCFVAESSSAAGSAIVRCTKIPGSSGQSNTGIHHKWSTNVQQSTPIATISNHLFSFISVIGLAIIVGRPGCVRSQ
jgi:hypothetical protein